MHLLISCGDATPAPAENDSVDNEEVEDEEATETAENDNAKEVTQESDEPEATDAEISAPVDHAVEEISLAEAVVGSDNDMSDPEGEAEAENVCNTNAAGEEDEDKDVGALKATTLLDITVIEERNETSTDAAILEAATNHADAELEAALNEIPELAAESVQEILQEARESVADGDDKKDLLKPNQRGWCCYLIWALLLALIAIAIALVFAHRDELKAIFFPPEVIVERSWF